jgi:O-antigen/teichoic acid export membrane protein
MYTPFLLLIPGILSLATLALVTAFNAGQGKIKMNLTGSILALFVIITGNFLFTPRFGIYSAATISSMGYICYQAYIMHQIKKEDRGIIISDFFRFTYSDISVIRKLFYANAKN